MAIADVAAKSIARTVDKAGSKAASAGVADAVQAAAKQQVAGDALKIGKAKVHAKLKLLVSDANTIDSPHLSPDGKQAVYVVRSPRNLPGFMKAILGLPQDEVQQSYKLMLAPTNGKGAPQVLWSNPFLSAAHPSFTPDGKAVIFSEQKTIFARGKNLENMRLMQKDLATGETKQIYNGEIALMHPSYSPDGKHIAAYARYPEGKQGLWLLDAQDPSKAPVRLTDHSDKHPVWSDDGSRLYFHEQAGGDANINARTADENAWIGYVDMSTYKGADGAMPNRVMLDNPDHSQFSYDKHPYPIPGTHLVAFHSAKAPGAKPKLQVIDTDTGVRKQLKIKGKTPNGSKPNAFRHVFAEDGKLVFVAKAKGKNKLDRGIAESWRAYSVKLDAVKEAMGLKPAAPTAPAAK